MESSEAQLSLEEPENRLPWLEAAEEDPDEGLDWERIGKAAAVMVVLALIVAAAVLLIRARLTAPPVGDGSIIAAPDDPYKVRPEDPGGKRFAGTGDTAYMVGEGIEPEGRIKASAAPVAAGLSPEENTSEGPLEPGQAPGAAASAEPTTPDAGVVVQIGAYASNEAALKGWQTLRDRYTPLAAYDRRVVEGRADIGTVHRLQAVAGSRAAADALCRDLRSNGIECQVKR